MPSPLNTGPSKIGLRKAGSESPKRGVAGSSKFEKIIRTGEYLFMEGDSGSEMYIIKQGKVRILKKEGSKMVALVTLGPGSVLGEMSLLDNAPRSASAEAIETVKVTVIDQNHLNTTLGRVPNWLNSIIKIVVQRLRETTNRNYQDVLRSGVVAVLRVIIHQAGNGAIRDKGAYFFPVEKILADSYSIFGLSNQDGNKIIKYLEMLNIGKMQKNKSGRSFMKIVEMEVVELFYDHLKTRWTGKKTLPEQASTLASELAKIIEGAGKSRGTRRDNKVSVDVKQIKVHMEQLGLEPAEVDEDVLKELQELNLVSTEQKATKTSQSTYNRSLVSYEPTGLPRFVMACEWLDYFSIDINEAL